MARRIKKGFSFRLVLSGTFSLLVLKRKPLAVSIVTFAMISAVLAAGLERSIEHIEDSIALSSGLQWEQLKSAVDERLQTFSEHDARLVLSQMKLRGALTGEQKENVTQEEASIAFIASVGPWILLSFLMNLLLLFVACVFFLLLAGSGQESGYESFRRLPVTTIRMVGLLLWFLVRSLLWIPLIGPIFAAYMTPRFALAPVLLANEQAGIFGSLHESMRKTVSRWFEVFRTLCGLGLLSIALVWFCLVLVVVVTLFSAKLGFLLWLITVMFVAAFQMFFLTALTVTAE